MVSDSQAFPIKLYKKSSTGRPTPPAALSITLPPRNLWRSHHSAGLTGGKLGAVFCRFGEYIDERYRFWQNVVVAQRI